MFKPLVVFCAALFSCLAIAPASARAAVPDQPSPGFTVQLESVNGSGCPVGSTAVSAPTNTEFTVTYANYLADAGNGASPGDFRKNCQLDVLVGVPAGWTYGIVSEQYRGFASLGTGAHGMLQTTYYFSGMSGSFNANQSLFGPTNSKYELDAAQRIFTWAPCHFTGTMNVNTSLQVFRGTDPTDFDEITMDSSDVGIATYFHLAFQQC
jgi:hypothetical protein